MYSATSAVSPPTERATDWVEVGDRVMCYIDDRAIFFPDHDSLVFSDRWIAGTVTIACSPARCVHHPYLSVRLDRTIFQHNPHRTSPALRREIVLFWTSPRILRLNEYHRLLADQTARDAWRTAAEAQEDHSPYSLEMLNPK